MATVFISYRRNDTRGEAGRLADDLQERLGRRFVFRDVVSISPGDQFDVVLKKRLGKAILALALIGPRWLDELKERLASNETDYLRLELAAVLGAGKRVIPVLINGANLPSAEELPEDLAALAMCQAITIRDEAWEPDVDRLIDAIGRPYRWDLLALRVAVAVIAILFVVWELAPRFAPNRISDLTFLRALVLSLVGIYSVIEVLIGYRHKKTLERMRAATRKDAHPVEVRAVEHGN